MNPPGDRNSRRNKRRAQKSGNVPPYQNQPYPPQGGPTGGPSVPHQGNYSQQGQSWQGQGQPDQPHPGQHPSQGGQGQQFGGQAPYGQGGYGNEHMQGQQPNGPGPQGGFPSQSQAEEDPYAHSVPGTGYQAGQGGSASTAYSRQQLATPQEVGGPNSRSAPESALSAPESYVPAEPSDDPTIIGTRIASTINEDPRSFLRVTVIHEDRKGDLLLPGNIPLAEILPSLVRKFTSLTPRGVTRGFILVGVDGKTLQPGRSLFDQDIKDGTVLSLATRVSERDKRYDDIVEAVADAAEETNKPWTEEDTATTAVAATVILTVTALALMIKVRLEVGMAVPIVAGVLSLLLLGLSWVLQRSGRDSHAVTIAILAALSAGATGLTLTEDPVIELPAVFGGLGIVLLAGLAMPLLKKGRELLTIPLVVGAIIAIIGGLYIAFDFTIPDVSVTIAGLVGIAILTVPLLTLRISGLDRDQDSIDTKETRKLYQRGHRLMMSFWISAAITLLIVAVPTVQTGTYGIAVMTLATLLLLMASRRAYGLADVAIHYLGALAVFVVTAAAILFTYPDKWAFVVVALLLVTVAIAAFGLVLGRTWTWTRRVADIVEYAAVILIIPATVLALELW